MDLVKVKPGAGDDRFPVLFVSGTQEIRRVLSHSCVAPSQIPPLIRVCVRGQFLD